MSIIQAIVLAIIEGLTEFLPISSTGHMIIASSLMGVGSQPFVKTFLVAIQPGAICAILVLYRRQFTSSMTLYYKLLVGFLPAAVVGFLLGDYIDVLLERVEVVGGMLLLGGVVFLFIDRMFRRTAESGKDNVGYPQAFHIGCFQTLALVPGVSRSAATIVGGLAQGLNRKAAAEFSFFLAIPTMFAATGYSLFKLYREGNGIPNEGFTLLTVGSVVAFVTALLAVKGFLAILTRYGFKYFGYYRIAAGCCILILYHLGIAFQIP